MRHTPHIARQFLFNFLTQPFCRTPSHFVTRCFERRCKVDDASVAPDPTQPRQTTAGRSVNAGALIFFSLCGTQPRPNDTEAITRGVNLKRTPKTNQRTSALWQGITKCVCTSTTFFSRTSARSPRKPLNPAHFANRLSIFVFFLRGSLGFICTAFRRNEI